MTKTKKINKSLIMKKKENTHTIENNQMNTSSKEKSRKIKIVKRKSDKPVLSRKDFRENPAVENFYKNIYEYNLREEAYKIAIEMYINFLLKEN